MLEAKFASTASWAGRNKLLLLVCVCMCLPLCNSLMKTRAGYNKCLSEVIFRYSYFLSWLLYYLKLLLRQCYHVLKKMCADSKTVIIIYLLFCVIEMYL